MPEPLFAGLLSLTGLYVVFKLACAAGWHRVVWASRGVDEPDPLPYVSVLIPARDEAETIKACLVSVLENEYPPDRLEVIVIDDASSDRTAAKARRIARRYAESVPAGEDSAAEEIATEDLVAEDFSRNDHSAGRENPVVRVVRVDHDESSALNESDAPVRLSRHKSAALRKGLEASTGEVIVTTDADCVVGPRWIRTLVRRCTDETPFVSGPLRYDWREKWFDRYQAVEMSALVAFGGGTIGAGIPTICNGGNVAVRRDLLDAYASDVPLAADEVLLQHVAYDTDARVVFEAHPDAVVETACVDTGREYVEQRTRWAWMGSRYPHAVPVAVSAFEWLTSASFLGLGVASIVFPAWQPIVMSCFLGKVAADAALTIPTMRHLGQNELTRTFIPATLFWTVSVTVMGLLGTFGTVYWKGRRVKR